MAEPERLLIPVFIRKEDLFCPQSALFDTGDDLASTENVKVLKVEKLSYVEDLKYCKYITDSLQLQSQLEPFISQKQE